MADPDPTVARDDPELSTMQCGSCACTKFALLGKVLDDGIYPKMVVSCMNCETHVKGVFKADESNE